MLTILGLGNPGQEYEETRHNAGRVVLSSVAKKLSLDNWFDSSKYKGKVTEGQIGGKELMILYPDTYMNHSGRAAKEALSINGGELVVVYDEVDLPFGEFKLSFGRGAGGHNGVQSVIDELGTNQFLRLRVGVAPRNWFGKIVRPKGEKLSNYVIGKLTSREKAKLEGIVDDVAQALKAVIEEGKEKAMSKFN